MVWGKDLKPGRFINCGCQQPKIQSKVGHKHKDAILKTMVEGTDIAVLNDRPTERSQSGIKGVFWKKQRGKWEARIGFQGKVYRMGVFDFIEDAAKTRKDAEKELFNPILEQYGKEPI